MSLPRVIVQLAEDERTRGLTLVGLSRCTRLDGMIIENVDASRLIEVVNAWKRDELNVVYARLKADRLM